MSDRKINYVKIAPEAYKRMSELGHYINTQTGIENTVLEFVKLRASQINGCHFCIDMHIHELKKSNETPDRIEKLAEWRDTAVYTQRERAALGFTEALTKLDEPSIQVAYDEVRAHFSEKETVDLAWAIAQINAWNRMGITFQPEFREPKIKLAAEDAKAK